MPVMVDDQGRRFNVADGDVSQWERSGLTLEQPAPAVPVKAGNARNKVGAAANKGVIVSSGFRAASADTDTDADTDASTDTDPEAA